MSRRNASEGQLSLELLLEARRPPAGEHVPAMLEDAEAPAPRISAEEIAHRLGRARPTSEQAAVIEAPLDPLLVIAGAGSGKTETMAARVVWLVANGIVEPDQVLGLTFTRKAAGELSERIRSRLRGLHRAGLSRPGPGTTAGSGSGQPSPVSVQTYHSYAAGVLADNSLRLGIEPGARLLGEAGAWQLVDEIVEQWDEDMTGVDSARGTVVDAVLSLAGECAEHLVELDDVGRLCTEMAQRIAELPLKAGDPVPGPPKPEPRGVLERLVARQALLPIVERYRRRKTELELLDFGDQVALAARLALEVPEVGAGERERYRVILLDEYQDTSYAQVVLLQSLFGAGHPVIAVGDPHQSIYAWRGASAGNLQRFGHDFPTAAGEPAGVRQLSVSWRNDHSVLAAANALAGPLRVAPTWGDPRAQVEVGPLVARPGAEVGEVRAEWHETTEAEVAAVADYVEAAWRSGERSGEPSGERSGEPSGERSGEAGAHPSIAVLCRARAQFPAIEAALRGRNLPVEVIGLGGLLHVPEIADVRAALEVMHDPGRGDSLMRLLTGAAWRLGPPDLDALGAWSKSLRNRNAAAAKASRTVVELDAVDQPSLIDALDQLPAPDWTGPAGQELSATGRHRLDRLASVLRVLRARTSLPLPELVLEVERALLLDIEVAARPGRSPSSARAHLDAFVDVAASFAENGDRPTLGSFLGWLSAAEAQERGLDTGVVEQHETAIQLLTVHGAKGLEWDVVAVTGLSEGTFPTGRNGSSPVKSKAWLTDLGALPYPLRGDRYGLPQWAYQAALSQEELAASLKAYQLDAGAHEVAEERRLAYVAITRARRRVLLTGALWADGVKPREPSRFLNEVAELAGSWPVDSSPMPTVPPVLPVAGISAGSWADAVEDGTANPRQLEERSTSWPLDPLGDRRTPVEEGAALVVAAIGELGSVRALDAAGLHPTDLDTGHSMAGDEERGWATEVELLLTERDAARSSQVAVTLPAHLSASRVVALASDPDALAMKLRRPMPEPPSPQARRGSAFHAWLERRFGSAALLDVEELPGAVDDREGDEDLAQLQANFLASEWASRTAEVVEVAVETSVAGIALRGRIDAVFGREGGGWDVVDWKTGAAPSGQRAAAAAVQLAVYRLAWSRLTGAPLDQVGAAFFYAASGETARPVNLLDQAGLEDLLTFSSTPAADG